MYEKMLHFLFPYIVEERGIEDKEGLMEEYIHWNGQLIEKCLYHLPHEYPVHKYLQGISVGCISFRRKYKRGNGAAKKDWNREFSV